MKVLLMHPDADFGPPERLPFPADDVIQDLGLGTLFDTMAQGDKRLREIACKAVMTGCGNDLPSIRYRQRILRDCLQHPAVVRRLYDLSVAAIDSPRTARIGMFSRHPTSLLHWGRDVLGLLLEHLRGLRAIADEQRETFESDGLRRLFRMLHNELPDDYFEQITTHLERLRFRRGVLVSAQLGAGNKGCSYTLRTPVRPETSWLGRLLGKGPPEYSFRLHPRDENGARAVSELQGRGLNSVANALAQSVDHIIDFFSALRLELGFYVGCINLHQALQAKGVATDFPVPEPACQRRYRCEGLYDPCLALTAEHGVVGNDAHLDGKRLVIITGANQGGKSVFLRSVGIAQLMMQCGMYVPARSLRASVCGNLFTHFRREEDAAMRSGKLDEELARMSAVVDALTPDALILLNESFAATNEREGSEIARQVCNALTEQGVRLWFVTHLADFARGTHDREMAHAAFLRAERRDDGARTYRMIEAAPLHTSFGEDAYRRVFGNA